MHGHFDSGIEMKSLTRSLAALLLCVSGLLVRRDVAAQQRTMIAAASDLSFALREIADQFVRDTGEQVELVFGSSGTLTRQIRDGAPFELFFSADEAFVDDLVAAELTRDRGTLYGVGRIVLFAPRNSPLIAAEGLDGLARVLAGGQITRFAIANPAVAPYGRAAEAALKKHGLWDQLQKYLVLGDNVTQAAQFATTGNAIGGIIAHSLVLAPTMRDKGTFALIPESDHPPLRQRMVLMKRSGPTAKRFYSYMQNRNSKAILERYGFTLPH